MNENIIGFIFVFVGTAFGIFYVYSYEKELKRIDKLNDEINKIIDKQL